MKRLLALGVVMGIVYYGIEELFRWGQSNPIMIAIGGICGVLVGLLNEYPSFYTLSIRLQCLLGTIIVLVIEFMSGMALNVWLKLNVWSYAGIWGNIMGQVCIPYALLWYFICVPLAIWLDDYLRRKLFGELELYSLKEVYLKLLRG
jgi:uncharacterized membrane protein